MKRNTGYKLDTIIIRPILHYFIITELEVTIYIAKGEKYIIKDAFSNTYENEIPGKQLMENIQY